VAIRATRAIAREVQDPKQQHQDEGNDPKHLHPAWCTWWSIRGLAAASVVAIGVGVGWQVSHVRVLLCFVFMISSYKTSIAMFYVQKINIDAYMIYEA
jgi:hypothetical protein